MPLAATALAVAFGPAKRPQPALAMNAASSSRLAQASSSVVSKCSMSARVVALVVGMSLPKTNNW